MTNGLNPMCICTAKRLSSFNRTYRSVSDL